MSPGYSVTPEDRMANSEGDIGGFLRSMVRDPVSERYPKPFVGIDECLNRREISELVRMLLRRDLIDRSWPLWYETRERDGVIVGCFVGGVDKDSSLREPNSFIPDIGVPVKHRSWSDFRVILLLVANFTHHDNLILLSENIRNDANGLRRILNEIVAPALALRSDRLSLTTLFKKGKTSITDYCLGVTTHLKQGYHRPGYVEVLL